jgi:methionyl-tRNA formyltransferase
MDKYVLVTSKTWHKGLFEKLTKYKKEIKWILIDNENLFILTELKKINPKKIFIPHWSKIIPKEIYNNYECILFHMTDLPFGRGGSPLQNLIVNGCKKTKISAIRVKKGIDTGPIYLKRDLLLNGSANDIFLRASKTIFEMIIEIIKKAPFPIEQVGIPTYFKRRNPDQSNISSLDKLNTIYDYIRMLDCEGYPNAYIELNGIVYEFYNVKKLNNKLESNVRIKFKK